MCLFYHIYGTCEATYPKLYHYRAEILFFPENMQYINTAGSDAQIWLCNWIAFNFHFFSFSSVYCRLALSRFLPNIISCLWSLMLSPWFKLSESTFFIEICSLVKKLCPREGAYAKLVKNSRFWVMVFFAAYLWYLLSYICKICFMIEMKFSPF